MKTLGLIFTFLLLINSVSYAFADHCLDDSACVTAADDCDQLDSAQDSSEKHTDADHEKCNVHCFHPQGFFTAQKNVDFNISSVSIPQGYSFHIKPVFLDGPLRPPLV